MIVIESSETSNPLFMNELSPRLPQDGGCGWSGGGGCAINGNQNLTVWLVHRPVHQAALIAGRPLPGFSLAPE